MKKNYFLTLLLILFSNYLVAQAIGYTGEIRLFAGTFAPQGWAFCDGSDVQIRQYTALYAVIGPTYGGDGKTYFKLPDLRGRVPVGAGQLGTSNFIIGTKGGQESITLTSAQMPLHTHAAAVTVSNENASTTAPTSSSSIAVSGMNSGRAFVTNSGYTSGGNVTLQTITTTPVGSSSPVKLSRPSLGLVYIICLNGDYPSRP